MSVMVKDLLKHKQNGNRVDKWLKPSKPQKRKTPAPNLREVDDMDRASFEKAVSPLDIQRQLDEMNRRARRNEENRRAELDELRWQQRPMQMWQTTSAKYPTQTMI